MQKVELSTQSSADSSQGIIKLEDGQNLVVTENDHHFMVCKAFGSNPTATITITFDGHDITDKFMITHHVKEDPSPNTVGLSDVTYDVQAIGRELLEVHKDSSRKKLICSASIPLQDAKTISVRPILQSM